MRKCFVARKLTEQIHKLKLAKTFRLNLIQFCRSLNSVTFRL